MAKTKPKWGFKSIVKYSPISQDEIQTIVEELKEKLNIDLSQELVRELTWCLSGYNSDKTILDKWPRRSEIRAALKATKKELIQEDQKRKKIINLLKELDPPSRSIIQEQSDFVNIEQIIIDLELLYGAVLDALRNVPNGKSGQKTKIAWRLMVHGLCGIYEKATGDKAKITQHQKKDSCSPFFSFFKICTKDADDNIDSEMTIERAIMEELRNPKFIPK